MVSHNRSRSASRSKSSGRSGPPRSDNPTTTLHHFAAPHSGAVFFGVLARSEIHAGEIHNEIHAAKLHGQK